MDKKKIKDILISILVGACVAFFSTLFQGLAEFFKDHTTGIMSGGISSILYIIKQHKA